MPLEVNLRHLDDQSVRLTGTLPVEDLDLDLRDDMVQAEKPLDYDLEVQELDRNVLAQGKVRLELTCQCVRCLKTFKQDLVLEHWTALLPLEGPEKVAPVNDCVDLTPHIREDILLEFPQHPLCKADCGGLPGATSVNAKTSGAAGVTSQKISAWAELDKLKLKN